MALQRQTKSFAFSQGVDTKTAPEVLPIGKLHSAENVRFYQNGKLSKKYGSTKFALTKEKNNQDAAGGNIGALNTVFTHQNGLIGISNNNIASLTQAFVNGTPESVYNYSPSSQRWNFAAKAAFCKASSKTFGSVDSFGSNKLLVSGNAYVSSLVSGGFLYTVSPRDVTGQFADISIVDLSTNEVAFTLTLAAVERPRIFTFGGYIYIIKISSSGTALTAECIDPSTGTLNIIGVSVTMVADLDSSKKLYDVQVGANGSVYIAYANNASGISVVRYTTLPRFGAATAANTTTIAKTPIRCINIFGTDATNNKVYVAYSMTGAMWSTALALDLSTQTSTQLDNVEYATLSGTTAVDRGSTYLYLVGQVYSAGTYGTFLRTFYISGTTYNVVTTIGNETYNMLLASKVAIYNGWVYAVVCNIDPTEFTYFLVVLTTNLGAPDLSANWHPVAKLLFGEGAPTTPYGQQIGYLADLTNDGSNNFYSVQPKFSALDVSGTRYCVPCFLKFDFTNINRYISKEIAGNAYLTGGFPMIYDGQTLFESSFLHSPLQPVVTSSVGTGPLTTGQTYQFCTVFQFVDANGFRHLSAPSIPVSATPTGGNTQVTFTAYPPSLTFHQYVDVLVYRTTGNGSLFYLDSKTRMFCNGKGISVTASQSDAAIISKELLYTTGNVVENQCPTSAYSLTPWKDRMWALTDDGVVYSKAVEDGFTVEFNPIFNINALVTKGQPIAIASMRDKLLVFYQDSIYYTMGDGPNDTGGGTDFSALELATMGVGCVNPAAVVEMQDQVMFLSRDGWRTITQALQVQYIGAEVQQYFNENTPIYYAQYCDSLHEVRISDGNRVYCYDTYLKQWFINTSWADKAGVLWSGTTSANKNFVRVRLSDGVPLYEDKTTFKDDTVVQAMTIRTGWISMDQFAGFERLYRIILLGRYQSAHTLTMKLFYDYVPQVVETFNYTSSSGNFASYTDTQVYQDDTYSGNGYPMEITFQPAVQKCQCVRIEITETPTGGNGQSFDLVGVNFVIGVKAGAAKIRDVVKGTSSGVPGFVP